MRLSISLSKRSELISLTLSFSKDILKLIQRDRSVGIIFLLLFIKIKNIFSLGSSNVFNSAFTEFKFKYSILSIKTNLGLLLNEDLLS